MHPPGDFSEKDIDFLRDIENSEISIILWQINIPPSFEKSAFLTPSSGNQGVSAANYPKKLMEDLRSDMPYQIAPIFMEAEAKNEPRGVQGLLVGHRLLEELLTICLYLIMETFSFCLQLLMNYFFQTHAIFIFQYGSILILLHTQFLAKDCWLLQFTLQAQWLISFF